MSTTLAPTTLSDMREATRLFTENGKPLTAKQVGDLVSSELGRQKPYDVSTVLKWESEGIENHFILKALEKIYRRPLEEIAAAAKRS